MTTRSNDRLEAELAGWLHGFEPSATPVALRIRTFADLRDEAARPHRRLEGLAARLSPLASLGTVVVGAGLFLLVAVAGASLNHSGVGSGSGAGALAYSPGEVGIPTEPANFSDAPGLFNWILLFGASVLVGCVAFLPRVPALAGRIAYGKGAAPAALPLPFRRSWRSVPLVTLPLAAIAIAVGAWGFTNLLTAPNNDLYAASICSLVAGIAIFLLPVVASWRYPLRDRSGKLLLAGTALPAALMLLELAMYFTDVFASLGEPYWIFWSVMAAAGAVALAASLVGRAGPAIRPSRHLAWTAGAVAFFVAFTFLFIDYYFLPLDMFSWRYYATLIPSYLSHWLINFSWLAILWVGATAWRASGGSKAWALVALAGALHLLADMPDYLHRVYTQLFPQVTAVVSDQTVGTVYNFTPYYLWQMAAGTTAAVVLLVALAIGLRPLPPRSEPTTAELAPSDDPDTEVAGETAGH